jgi:hypothetical protein
MPSKSTIRASFSLSRFARNPSRRFVSLAQHE